MRLAFPLIGIEQRCGQGSVLDGRQLPRQVGRIAHAAVHALPGERRRQVRGVAGQKTRPDFQRSATRA